ncbi:MAG: clostripain-related cysteine peptidase, partial [Candidatus Wallbacteria bacterium]|nr:clostripain-related cysteine peptidase [Candidatus Wallbacteria bacterium]
IAMVELKAAMAEGKTTFGKNIAVVEMDACLMGLFEVAYQIKESCDFVSFSEEVEPMDGIPYKAILPQIVAATTPEEVVKIIVKEFKTYYEGNLQGFSGVTKSAVKCSELKGLSDNFTAVLQGLEGRIAEYREPIKASRSEAVVFQDSHGNPYSYTDLPHFIGLLKQRISGEVTTFLSTLEQGFGKAIVANAVLRDKYQGAGGLAVYFPSKKSQLDTNLAGLALYQDAPWFNFLNAYYGTGEVTGDDDTNSSDPWNWDDWFLSLNRFENRVNEGKLYGFSAGVEFETLKDKALAVIEAAARSGKHEVINGFFKPASGMELPKCYEIVRSEAMELLAINL